MSLKNQLPKPTNNLIYILPHIIENAARNFPDKDAFRCGNDALTFTALNSKTNQLAKHLVESGVKKGDRVGIYMNRCLETVIAVYGIMKCGAAYVPMDVMAPHSRTHFLIQDCGIQFLISTAKQTKRIQRLLEQDSLLVAVIGISDELNISSFSWDSIFKIDLKAYQRINILSEDLAYVMYTSGSTGAPKGIMHTHYSALSYAILSANLYGLQSIDRIANHAPLHFDISTFGYFSAPLAGATTIIVPDAHTKLPVSLAELMEMEKVSIWYSVPLALIQLYLSGALENRNLKSLRWVLFGGENFTLKYLRALMICWPDAKFSNVYGPAEVNQCTYYNLESLPVENEQIPIGRVWDNTEFKILNKENKVVPYGETGELVVRTATMMMGYWNNDQLTQKSLFIENLANNLKHVYYRTGDLVKQDAKGNLLFLGRNDRQVKLRGYRIELDEIEAVLKRNKVVEEAAVCVVETDNKDKKLTAAVLIANESNIEPSQLIAFCQKHLPPYAVPDTIVLLDEFPRTSSGKTDLTSIKKILIAI